MNENTQKILAWMLGLTLVGVVVWYFYFRGKGVPQGETKKDVAKTPDAKPLVNTTIQVQGGGTVNLPSDAVAVRYQKSEYTLQIQKVINEYLRMYKLPIIAEDGYLGDETLRGMLTISQKATTTGPKYKEYHDKIKARNPYYVLSDEYKWLATPTDWTATNPPRPSGTPNLASSEPIPSAASFRISDLDNPTKARTYLKAKGKTPYGRDAFCVAWAKALFNKQSSFYYTTILYPDMYCTSNGALTILYCSGL
jgi:hypothetical protein